MVIVVIGVVVFGTAVGFGAESSAEGAVQNFLLDWQSQDYAAAGTLTTAGPTTVAAALKGTYGQLDATALYLSMDSIVQHGKTAEATFTASFDLAEEGRVWTYNGQFGPATESVTYNGTTRTVSNPLAETYRFAGANRGAGQIWCPWLLQWDVLGGREFPPRVLVPACLNESQV